MHESLKDIIEILLRKRYIGGKHFPERLLIVSKTKFLNKESRSHFEQEYEKLSREYFIRLKKRTGKGSEWHISVNPDKIEELKNMIGDEYGQ